MKYISFSKKKTSNVKLEIINGNGKIIINKISIKKYFGGIINKNYVFLPLIISNIINKDIFIYVKGGGKLSQINCIKNSLCKCILLFNYNYFKIFRKLNLISIDDRKVERKKYGKKKSRKKEQYSKR